MSELDPGALDVAAKATGLRSDQVARAVAEYRAAADELHAEPTWRATFHMCGQREAMHQYTADGTSVALQINSFKKRNDEWEEERIYTLDGEPYESFGEARAAELRANTRPKPYALTPLPAPPAAQEKP